MNRLTDKELRHCRRTGIVGRCHADHNQAARDALAYRRALRHLARLCAAHAKKGSAYPTCGLFGDARFIIARALGSKK